MEYISLPIIVLVCYLFFEIYKVIFKEKENLYKLIPIFSGLFGGLLGILIFLTSNEMKEVSNIYQALGVGIISGFAATGTNQSIKQIIKGGNKGE